TRDMTETISFERSGSWQTTRPSHNPAAAPFDRNGRKNWEVLVEPDSELRETALPLPAVSEAVRLPRCPWDSLCRHSYAACGQRLLMAGSVREAEYLALKVGSKRALTVASF